MDVCVVSNDRCAATGAKVLLKITRVRVAIAPSLENRTLPGFRLVFSFFSLSLSCSCFLSHRPISGAKISIMDL